MQDNLLLAGLTTPYRQASVNWKVPLQLPVTHMRAVLVPLDGFGLNKPVIDVLTQCLAQEFISLQFR